MIEPTEDCGNDTSWNCKNLNPFLGIEAVPQRKIVMEQVQ